MNRNIIFRGRELATGAWYEGYFVRNFPDAFIVKIGDYSITGIAVDPDTVQQMTCTIHDGRPVWEGDVFADPAAPEQRYTVHYSLTYDGFRIRWRDDKGIHMEPMMLFLATHPELEYVGNIIDLTDYSSNRPNRNSRNS